ncbi:MAG: UbiX family flavin prenyltransferase [Acidobacteria bacterium]|nr:UbiX family flavin prenyltransferase [Acidobacteriota bacterium]
MKQIAVALTGASGAPYFLRLCQRLSAVDGVQLHLLASESGRRVLHEETDQNWKTLSYPKAMIHNEKDVGASLASGSVKLDALVVAPCSMSTLSAVAYGFTEHLIHRVASVQLKERRPLILVPRELPFSLVHLRAMTACCEAGAFILPACPSFYMKPANVMDLVDTVVDRVLDHLGIEDPAIKRWQS